MKKDFFVNNKTVGIFVSLLFLLFSYHLDAFAQSDQFSELQSSIEDEILLPEVGLQVLSGRKIGGTTVVSAFISNIDVQSADFLWYVDDELYSSDSGVSKKTFSFVQKKKNHVVRLVIMDKDVRLAENAILVSSYGVSLVWSADTYTPSDYFGKSLPVRGSRVSVVAIPELGGVKSKDLVFSWFVDAKSYVRGVVGQDEFSFFINKSQDNVTVSVEVSNLSGTINLVEGISIPIVRPSVVLTYKESEKLVERYVPDLNLSPGEEVSFRAVPYNFRVKNNLDFKNIWEFLGVKAESTNKDPAFLKFTIPEDSALGSGLLTLRTENKVSFRERAFSDININIVE